MAGSRIFGIAFAFILLGLGEYFYFDDGATRLMHFAGAAFGTGGMVALLFWNRSGTYLALLLLLAGFVLLALGSPPSAR